MRRTLLVAMATLVWLGLAAPPASAHSVSGQSATNFQTTLRSVEPAVPGLEVKVVEAGSRLEVENRTGQELVVIGYKDEPYLRIGPDGVFENKLSTSTYISRSRKGGKPPEAAEKARIGDTDWEKVSSEPIARWHDHRIHWMGEGTLPPQVEDEGERTRVFGWEIPMASGGRPVEVRGTLTWLGKDEDGFPVAAGLTLGGALVGGALLVVVVRRRRSRAETPAKEAW